MEEVIFTGYESNFAMRLRDLMNEFGTTQKNLADYTGITRQAIAQYMEGSVQPNVERLYKIAKYFNVSADYLLGITDQRTSNIDDKAIHEAIGLSDKAIEKLKGYQSYLPSVLIPTLNELIEYEPNADDLSLFEKYKTFTTLNKEELDDHLNSFDEKKQPITNNRERSDEPPDFWEGPLLLIRDYFNSVVDKEGCLSIGIGKNYIGSVDSQQIIDSVILDSIKEVLIFMRKKYDHSRVKAKIRYKKYAETWDESYEHSLLEKIKFDDTFEESKSLFEELFIKLLKMKKDERETNDSATEIIIDFFDEFINTFGGKSLEQEE